MFFVEVCVPVLSSKRQASNNPEFTEGTSDKLVHVHSTSLYISSLWITFPPFFCFVLFCFLFFPFSLRCKCHWSCGATWLGHSWRSDCRLDSRKHLLDRQQFGPNWSGKARWHFEDNINSWSHGASKGHCFGSQIWVIINYKNIFASCWKVF